MASSSGATTSSALSRRPASYDMFINFRGVDTRDNFVWLLYEALRRGGIHAFIDSEELWEGEEICPSLERAIRGSKISIPVFSEHYADSKYCLLELAQIWESHLSEGQTILPIFIGVEPRDVRHQTGSFQDPFKEHQSKCDSARVESWKNALTEVGNLKGWTLKGDATIKEQSNIVELVVQRVVRELHSSNPLDEEKHLIGIDSHVKELLHLLHYGSDDVRFVGICGMGGLGKTTIAKAIYNRIFRSFNGSSFLTDVREEASQGNKGLVSLQKQLLHDIFQRDYNISIASKGSKLIAERLHREKVLLILDDVNDYTQLDALVGEFNWFGQGSKVVITTRDVHILNVYKEKVGQDIQIYMPEELDSKNSLLLFSLRAFSNNEPPEHYKQLSNEVVSYIGGLPLSLEVLGSFLIDKDKKEWKDTLEILKDIGNDNNVFGRSIKAYDDRVFEKLKISYNQLGYREKTIFLDVACYFNGWKKEKAISLWDACELHPRLAIKELIQKHLLKIDHYRCLKMHDQLQAMGRRIILEDCYGDPAKRSRLWSQDEIWKVMKEDKGTQMVEGMLIQNFEVEAEDEFGYAAYVFGYAADEAEDEFGYEADEAEDDESEDEFVSEDDEFEAEDVLSCEAFQKMPNLRFLELYGIGSLNGEFAHLPSKLRWFRCRDMNILPPDFYHPELVHLELCCVSLQQSWNDTTQNKEKRFHKLKILNLSDHTELFLPPDFFLWFPCLQRLNLDNCHYLLELPDSICRLASLKSITVSHCGIFRKLPTSIGDLKHLVELCLYDTSIQGLPDAVGHLETLEKLVVSSHQDHGNYPQLVKLPASMGRMKSLHHFTLTGYQIEKIPDDFSKLLSLEVFIMCIPIWWQQMDVWFSFKSLLELPSTLTHLQLKQCDSLQRISVQSHLERLEELSLWWCKSLVELPDLSNLRRLRKLHILKCENLKEIPSLKGTESLEEFNAWGCDKLRELSDLSNLRRLRKLDISNCENLEEIPSLKGTESLEELNARGCHKLRDLPDLSKLKKLRKLEISYCENLEKIHGLEGTESLEELNAWGCNKLRELLDLSKLKRLRSLSVKFCENIEKIHGLEGTESMEELDVSYCSKLKELPDLSKLKRLRKLNIQNCKNLEEIRGLDRTESLIELYMQSCFKITETTKKILGQGTFVDDGVGQMQGINGSPILCVVFAFTPAGLTLLLAGKLGTISLEIYVLIRRGEIRTSCFHSIIIEDIKFTTQDIIYIHYFKGLDWFGLPLESKDALRLVSAKISTISDSYKDHIFCPPICNVKFVEVLFENKESNRDIPNQQSSAKLVAEFFRWSDADDAEKVEQQKAALRASNCYGISPDHDEDDEDKDQQRLDQPSHVQEKGKKFSSEGTQVEEEETSNSEEIGEEEERNYTTAERWEEEEKLMPSKRSCCHYNDDEEMPIQQPNIDDEVQGIPSDIDEAERRNKKFNLLSSSFGGVGGSNNVPEKVVEEEDETKAGMQFLCTPVKAVWDCFCNCFTPGFLP